MNTISQNDLPADVAEFMVGVEPKKEPRMATLSLI
tara:strand:- start:2340 stop:2444 length:105 start_codon:yes stop_codon:yes gene_type:complete